MPTPPSSIKPIAAGRLRRKITIQQRAAGTDQYGGPSATWNTVLTTWGDVQPKAQNALIAALAGQAMPKDQYVVTLRYPPSIAIKAGMRVLDVGTGRTLIIHQAQDSDERHRMLTLFCQDEPAPASGT